MTTVLCKLDTAGVKDAMVRAANGRSCFRVVWGLRLAAARLAGACECYDLPWELVDVVLEYVKDREASVEMHMLVKGSQLCTRTLAAPHTVRNHGLYGFLCFSEVEAADVEGTGFVPIPREALEGLKRNRKLVKKYFKHYTGLCTYTHNLHQVARLLGPAIHNISKFPNGVTHRDQLPAALVDLKSKLRIRCRSETAWRWSNVHSRSVSVQIGHTGLRYEQLMENVEYMCTSMEQMVHPLGEILGVHLKIGFSPTPYNLYGRVKQRRAQPRLPTPEAIFTADDTNLLRVYLSYVTANRNVWRLQKSDLLYAAVTRGACDCLQLLLSHTKMHPDKGNHLLIGSLLAPKNQARMVSVLTSHPTALTVCEQCMELAIKTGDPKVIESLGRAPIPPSVWKCLKKVPMADEIATALLKIGCPKEYFTRDYSLVGLTATLLVMSSRCVASSIACMVMEYTGVAFPCSRFAVAEVNTLVVRRSKEPAVDGCGDSLLHLPARRSSKWLGNKEKIARLRPTTKVYVRVPGAKRDMSFARTVTFTDTAAVTSATSYITVLVH
eukprot:TRINITY_DN38283_c0_g1_i1.p1 TRINITY_DN38283_c0_g1~~TRINITY_DN38283_c0_g1_i1.p1  ORF type:complete len:552 (+),score=79.32 TRINITY_DN38283_c0_g1_i1:259-1914(+)